MKALNAMMVKVSLTPGEALNAIRHEVANISVITKVALHQKVILSRRRVHLRDLLHFSGLVGHFVRLAKFALHHDENGLHGGIPFVLPSQSERGRGGRARNAGTSSVTPNLRLVPTDLLSPREEFG